ncbi:hypothetical protein TeGR_g2789, partial [Tetraparma gracilis]
GGKDEEFRGRTLRILVAAAGAASRGVDCADCHTCYFLDLPGTGDDYVHRGGRAGRGGREGRIVSIVGGEKELFALEKLGREVGVDIVKAGS